MLRPGQWDKRELVPTPFFVLSKHLCLQTAGFGNLSAQAIHSMHIGEAIKQELESQGKTVVWFAEQLSCHRTNVYRIFEKASIDTHLLIRISKILGHDFFADHSKTLDI